MKKIFTILTILALIISVGCERTDFDEILRRQENQLVTLNDHEARLKVLENLVETTNDEIKTIKGLIEAVDQKVSIVSYKELADKTGYELTMSDNTKITLKNGAKRADGKDGADGQDGKDGINGTDGKDGVTPAVNVKLYTDGYLYWTLNGEYMLDANGNMILAQGKDGADGQDGVDGQDGKDGINGTDGVDGVNGTDGKDGIDGVTPTMRVNTTGNWEMSADGGTTWQEVKDANNNPVPATGPAGQDGATGPAGPAGPQGPGGSAGAGDLTITTEGGFTIITYNGTEYFIKNGCEAISNLTAKVNTEYKIELSWTNPDPANYPADATVAFINVEWPWGSEGFRIDKTETTGTRTSRDMFTDGEYEIPVRITYLNENNANETICINTTTIKVEVVTFKNSIVGTWIWEKRVVSEEQLNPNQGGGLYIWVDVEYTKNEEVYTFNADGTYTHPTLPGGTYTVSEPKLDSNGYVYHIIYLMREDNIQQELWIYYLSPTYYKSYSKDPGSIYGDYFIKQ